MANGRWPPPTIQDYYRAVIEEVKKKVESTPDDQVLGMDLDQWVDYLVQTHAMQEIEFDALHRARSVQDLRYPGGNRLETLRGDRAGEWSLRVNDRYRITFRFEDGHAYEVACEDYH